MYRWTDMAFDFDAIWGKLDPRTSGNHQPVKASKAQPIRRTPSRRVEGLRPCHSLCACPAGDEARAEQSEKPPIHPDIGAPAVPQIHAPTLLSRRSSLTGVTNSKTAGSGFGSD
jgi:hypothetical protein